MRAIHVKRSREVYTISYDLWIIQVLLKFVPLDYISTEYTFNVIKLVAISHLELCESWLIHNMVLW